MSNNVLFKQGTQAALDSIRTSKTAIPGAFYLTNDSHRLYIGTEGKDAVPVNEGITTVASTSDLPEITATNGPLMAGQFYYIAGTATSPVNILAVCNGQKWIQINSHTAYVTEFTSAVSETTDGKVAKVTSTVKDNDGKTYASSFSISVAGGLVLDVDATNKVVSIDASALKLTLSSTVANGTATVNLKNSDASIASKIEIVQGANVTLSGEADKITIAAKDTTNTSLDVSSPSTGGFEVKVTDSNGKTVKDTFSPTIRLNGVQSTDTIFNKDGIADLPTYSKTEIDTMFKGIDAMVYRGVLDGTAAPTTNVKIGDTYKIGVKDISYTGKIIDEKTNAISYNAVTNAKVGDILIANVKEGKTEGSDGIIAAGDLYWDLIPAGDDDDTYKGVSTSTGLDIQDGSGNSVGSISIGGDTNYITVAQQNGTGKASSVLKVAHKTITQNDGSAATYTKTANSTDTYVQSSTKVDGVKTFGVDSAGHVTGKTAFTTSIADTNATLESTKDITIAAETITGMSSAVGVSSKTTLTQSSGRKKTATGKFKLATDNDNIKFTADDTNDTVKMSLVWGTFSAT